MRLFGGLSGGEWLFKSADDHINYRRFGIVGIWLAVIKIRQMRKL